jgi:hypothetical protein
VEISAMKISSLLAALVLFSGCSQPYGMYRSERGTERPDILVSTDGYSLIRGINSEISAERITDEKWQAILRYKRFITSSGDGYRYRIPKFTAFQIIVKNTGRTALTIESCSLQYGETMVEALTLAGITETTSSPVYSSFDFPALMDTWRLLGKPRSAASLDYDADIHRFLVPAIPPDDTIVHIVFFPWIPVEVRSYKLVVTEKTRGRSRPVVFGFIREEYRIRGDYMKKPESPTDTFQDY